MSYFPDHVHPDAGVYAVEYFKRLAAASATVDPAAIAAAAQLLVDQIRRGGRIYSCGNGGSAAIANHLVCDHMKGIRAGTALRPKVHSLSATVEIITAIVNDISSEEMFSFQLSSLGAEGDVLIAISSSGSSPNILRALDEAKSLGMATIAMTGFSGGDSVKKADISLHVDCENYGIVEDIHQSLMHILAQYSRHANLDDASELGKIRF
jgi:phosphoheptose isomerase